MTRELAPHGTSAAAKRHQRAGEPLCDPCRTAWTERRADQQARSEGRVRESVTTDPESACPRLSELEEVRANLALVVRAMESAPASAIAPLSRRREELDTRLRRLEDENARTLHSTGADDATFAALLESAGVEL